MPGQPIEPLGRRIAEHRTKLGWTQQELADRMAMSRVAVSHLEAGMSAPGERTVVLLAGLFKVEPYELVAGTDYPPAKTDRLPAVAARYTEVELQLAVMDAELRLVADDPAASGHLTRTWLTRLRIQRADHGDRRERALLDEAITRLRRAP